MSGVESVGQMARDEAAMRSWRAAVSEAAAGFESRWTELALARVDAGLLTRLREQRSLFDRACITGTAEEIETHGAAMCRGYAAAVRALEQAGAADDAYLLGVCSETGVKVAVGQQRAAVDRVRQLHGQDVVWITPDEVATLFASVEAFKAIGAVKRAFPGAELVRRYATAGS